MHRLLLFAHRIALEASRLCAGWWLAHGDCHSLCSCGWKWGSHPGVGVMKLAAAAHLAGGNLECGHWGGSRKEGFVSSVGISIVFTARAFLLFRITKQKSSRKHPSGCGPKAGVQRLASSLGSAWHRSTLLPREQQCMAGKSWFIGGAAPRAGAAVLLGVGHQYLRLPYAVVQLRGEGA